LELNILGLTYGIDLNDSFSKIADDRAHRIFIRKCAIGLRIAGRTAEQLP
jgi:hypothetical protein